MKHYPSIKNKIDPKLAYWVFDKLDGSNIRAEWNRKNGFYKFGSRKILIDESSTLAEAVTLVEAQAEAISKALCDQLKADSALLYFEFFGPSSFAGEHVPGETHECCLIDCDIKGRGQIDPADFVAAFGPSVKIPKVVHVGKVTDAFVQNVRNGTLPGMTFEGVVGKSVKTARWIPPHMFKQKNKAWLDAVIAKYGENAKERL